MHLESFINFTSYHTLRTQFHIMHCINFGIYRGESGKRVQIGRSNGSRRRTCTELNMFAK